jgi:hypothetical protein
MWTPERLIPVGRQDGIGISKEKQREHPPIGKINRIFGGDGFQSAPP